MPSERDPTVEALIRDGRQAYAAKRYKNALECFTRVRPSDPAYSFLVLILSRP